MKITHAHITLLLLFAIACKQTYNPPAIAHPPDYLVVEGFIESNGFSPTVFHLSHTVKLDSPTFVPEAGATVAIEDSINNTSYSLTEGAAGTYYFNPYFFPGNTTYRLHIRTTAGKEYASDFVPLVHNPPIDSITFARVQTPAYDGVYIYANTHDPQNNTHYYRWQYTETWQFHTTFMQNYVYDPATGGLIGAVGLNNYICWHSDSSTAIVLNSTTQLAQDLVFHAPVVFIPNGSQQMMTRYSILVKQTALTKDAFTWWQTMQKNTEQIGSIFGVQPSANPGNIHCINDPIQQVLGYVGGGNTDSQRIFVTNEQAQPWRYESGCVDITLPPNTRLKDYLDNGFLVWNIGPPPDFKVHMSEAYCIDCTLTGTNKRPSFW